MAYPGVQDGEGLIYSRLYLEKARPRATHRLKPRGTWLRGPDLFRKWRSFAYACLHRRMDNSVKSVGRGCMDRMKLCSSDVLETTKRILQNQRKCHSKSSLGIAATVRCGLCRWSDHMELLYGQIVFPFRYHFNWYKQGRYIKVGRLAPSLVVRWQGSVGSAETVALMGLFSAGPCTIDFHRSRGLLHPVGLCGTCHLQPLQRTPNEKHSHSNDRRVDLRVLPTFPVYI